MRYYLDTSIWLDYYEKRGVNGEQALKLILRIIERNELIFYSDFHIIELKRLNYTTDQMIDIFRIAKPNHLRRVHLQKYHFRDARIIAHKRAIPPGDALHALVAKENGAIILSRDRDFEKLRDICETKAPEDSH